MRKQQSQMAKQWYTVAEVSAQLKVHRTTINRWAREGRIKSTMAGGKRLISMASLDQFLREA